MTKTTTNSSILLELFNNKMLVTKVDVALDEGKSYDYIIDLCANYDFSINKPALTRYKEKRREAIELNVPLEDMLDRRRKKGNIVDMKSKETNLVAPPGGEMSQAFENIETVYNDLQVLDTIIQKGFNGIQFVDAIEIPQVLRAMEVKSKITGNQLQGLSMVGLRELRLRAIAKETAMTEVILQYIDEKLHDEVMQAVKDAEDEFYENLDLTEEDQRLTEALEQAGVKL